MKKIFCLLSLIALAVVVLQLMPTQQTQAQPIQTSVDGPYHFVNTNGVAGNATNNVAVAFTNSYSAIDISEHNYLGVQLTFKGTGAATGTVQVDGFQSIDSSNYETTASFSKLVVMNGTTLVSTNWDISVPTGRNIKFTLGNTNTTVAVTNLVFQWCTKSVKVDARR